MRHAPRPEPAAPEPGSRPGPLAFSLRFADARHRPHLPRHRVRRWAAAALAALGTPPPAELALRIVDEAEGLALNRSYRGGDHATNVLTFDYAREPVVVADIVICAPVVEREAAALARALDAHYAHLVVHGTLHALGLDHGHDAEAEAMEAAESAVMRRLGFDDPYAERAREPSPAKRPIRA
jgi:probable rRNA maturation factor